MDKKPELTPEELQTKQLELLKKLHFSEEFNLWRKEYVQTTLDQMKFDLANDDKMTEAELRAKLKTYYWLEEFFFNMFEKVDFQLKQK